MRLKGTAPVTATIILFFSGFFSNAQPTVKNQAQILYSPGHPLHNFIPSTVIGSAFDGHGKNDINRILSPENIEAMLQLNFGPLAYRLRTELGSEAWHWNPRGYWSEPAGQQGYWISDTISEEEISISNGYRLPRRGNSHDQANDDGYSMIDDGDTNTFWKSNPYLDEYFTHDSNSLHPQWVVIDLGKTFPVNAIRILWNEPFALSLKADWAPDIGTDYFDPLQPDLWHDFNPGEIMGLHGGNATIQLSPAPVKLRFLRITMSESSKTSHALTNDIRDRLGFSIKELGVGQIDDRHHFHDFVKHDSDNEKQSVIHTSSTDPWHRAMDIDTSTEQCGIDKFFTCGLASGRPVLMPAALLYDTPDDMVALLKYVKKKNYDVHEFEMGEEPEGQLIDPHDYATLYCQWASELKKIDSSIQLGGPGFASLATTPDDQYSFTEQKWTQMFLDYIRSHHHVKDFNFFSFEWYPFDNVCLPTSPQLAANPQLLTAALKDLQKKILPDHTPIYITEYGYSSHSGRAQVDVEGALMYGDILGKALSLGVSKAFLYGYEPTTLDVYNNCSWGNNMLFAMNERGKIIYHTAAFYGVNMLTHNWAVPGDSVVSLYPVLCRLKNNAGQDLLCAYAILTSGSKWSVLLINKDPRRAQNLAVSIFNTETHQVSSLKSSCQLTQYSRLQYRWKPNGVEGHPVRELPALEESTHLKNSLILPPYSITVLREN